MRVQEATVTQDAVIQLECYCGEVDIVLTEAGSAAGFFIKNVIKKIENAPENGYCGFRYLSQVMEAKD